MPINNNRWLRNVLGSAQAVPGAQTLGTKNSRYAAKPRNRSASPMKTGRKGVKNSISPAAAPPRPSATNTRGPMQQMGAASPAIIPPVNGTFADPDFPAAALPPG